mmetsp:Transcript_29494/g.76150  ORF Transcript_29494/g.76150 Transcript_29494/m.76150 type:complete len:206 (+) Transcript_29494:162-779(+)
MHALTIFFSPRFFSTSLLPSLVRRRGDLHLRVSPLPTFITLALLAADILVRHSGVVDHDGGVGRVVEDITYCGIDEKGVTHYHRAVIFVNVAKHVQFGLDPLHVCHQIFVSHITFHRHSVENAVRRAVRNDDINIVRYKFVPKSPLFRSCYLKPTPKFERVRGAEYFHFLFVFALAHFQLAHCILQVYDIFAAEYQLFALLFVAV